VVRAELREPADTASTHEYDSRPAKVHAGPHPFRPSIIERFHTPPVLSFPSGCAAAHLELSGDAYIAIISPKPSMPRACRQGGVAQGS
jgi:hypothetical protein